MALVINYSLHSFSHQEDVYDSEWGKWLKIIAIWQLEAYVKSVSGLTMLMDLLPL